MADSETKVITAKLEATLVAKVDEFADRMDRTRDSIIQQALIAWLDRQAKHDRLTREALDEVDAGRLVEHEDVQAWVDSLATDNPLPLPTPR